MYNIVVYLLNSRIMEAEEQPLLGNGPYTRSRKTRHISCDIEEVLQATYSVDPRRAKLLRNCSKHISAIRNNRGRGVFCESTLRLYNEDLKQLELELNRIPELAVGRIIDKKWQERN
jgi:hypothetical protein